SCPHAPAPPRLPPSSPTRRSSDLRAFGIDPRRAHADALRAGHVDVDAIADEERVARDDVEPMERHLEDHRLRLSPAHLVRDQDRSEEHTSELQSLTNLVCRLLLEK